MVQRTTEQASAPIGHQEAETAALKNRITELHDILTEWLYFAEEKFSEFDLENEADCEGRLCHQCESNGCIQYKIRRTRTVLGS